jgi:hypothetical protein
LCVVQPFFQRHTSLTDLVAVFDQEVQSSSWVHWSRLGAEDGGAAEFCPKHSVPDHCKVYVLHLSIQFSYSALSIVRWDPRRTDETFFDQSAYLYSAYYLLLITVHRPFVPSEGKENAMAVPALLICTNAARSCARVIDAHAKRRNGQVPTQIVRTFLRYAVVVRQRQLTIWG